MLNVETRAGRVSYTEQGDGPPLVLLHAILHDHHDYDPVVGALAADHRVIAVDWPGHGESDSPAEVTAPLLADTLEDIVRELDLRDVRLIGNSVGGFAAARLAITQPERVAGLILVDTGGFGANNPITRSFCRLMGTPALTRRIMPRFVRSYMQPTKRSRAPAWRSSTPATSSSLPHPRRFFGSRTRFSRPSRQRDRSSDAPRRGFIRSPIVRAMSSCCRNGPGVRKKNRR